MALKDHRLTDGENEYITIERIVPVMKGRNHLHPDYWQAEGKLDGLTMKLTILHEDRPMFLNAGYTPYDIFKNIETSVHIGILTTKDDRNRWRVAEVIHAEETAHVHTEAERQAAWGSDVRAFGGKVTVSGCEARFIHLGDWVTWTKDERGNYVRITETTRTLYVGKGQS